MSRFLAVAGYCRKWWFINQIGYNFTCAHLEQSWLQPLGCSPHHLGRKISPGWGWSFWRWNACLAWGKPQSSTCSSSICPTSSGCLKSGKLLLRHNQPLFHFHSNWTLGWRGKVSVWVASRPWRHLTLPSRKFGWGTAWRTTSHLFTSTIIWKL